MDNNQNQIIPESPAVPENPIAPPFPETAEISVQPQSPPFETPVYGQPVYQAPDFEPPAAGVQAAPNPYIDPYINPYSQPVQPEFRHPYPTMEPQYNYNVPQQPATTVYGQPQPASPDPYAPQYQQVPAIPYPTAYPTGFIPPQPGSGAATASMILGIVSLVLCCAGIGFIGGIAGLITGIVAKTKGNKSGTATAGIILSVIGLVLGVLVLIVYIAYGYAEGSSSVAFDM